MAPKREPIRLTIEKKYEIIQMIDTGLSERTVAKKYGITRSTVSIIRSRREEIIKFVRSNLTTTGICAIVLGVGGSVANFHKALHQWYRECKENNISVTNAMLEGKARELNAKFRTNHSFKGSLRWLSRFKERSDFCKADRSDDFGNQYEADIFKAEIRELLQDGEYTLDNVYNADSTVLMWKVVPEKTLLFEKSQSMRRIGGEQVITFICVNATGCHKLPVLIISTIKDFPSFNNLHTSAPSNTNKSNKPFIDSNILYKWFNDCFLKSVTARQQKNGQRKKTLLLLHNGGSGHENRIINTKDEFVKIMYYSYDAAQLIQPMDRGIIACFKRMYRNEFLETLMPTSNSVSEEEIIHIYSQLNIHDCCRMIKKAWSKVKNPILKNAWDKLLRDESDHSSEDSETIKKDINEALEKLNKIPGCGGCDSIAVMNWFETDKEQNTDTQVDIQDTLLDFINATMDIDTNELTDESFENILDDSSS